MATYDVHVIKIHIYVHWSVSFCCTRIM